LHRRQEHYPGAGALSELCTRTINRGYEGSEAVYKTAGREPIKERHIMKNFIVYYEGYYYGAEIKNASEVVEFVKKNNYFDSYFEIDWKTPLTGEYATIVKYKDGFISFNRNFKIPYAFKKLI
jgi:hypothetical protein